MRREFLKGYVLALLHEGAVSWRGGPAVAAAEVGRALAEDLKGALAEVATMVAANGVRLAAGKAAGKVAEGLERAARAIEQDGLGTTILRVAEGLRDAYQAGAEEQARRTR